MVTTVREDHQAERLRVFAVEARMVVGECLCGSVCLLIYYYWVVVYIRAVCGLVV